MLSNGLEFGKITHYIDNLLGLSIFDYKIRSFCEKNKIY